MPHKTDVARRSTSSAPQAARLDAVNCVAPRRRSAGGPQHRRRRLRVVACAPTPASTPSAVAASCSVPGERLGRSCWPSAGAGAAEVVVVNRIGRSSRGGGRAGRDGRSGPGPPSCPRAREADLVVNATSVGMDGDGSTPIDELALASLPAQAGRRSRLPADDRPPCWAGRRSRTGHARRGRHARPPGCRRVRALDGSACAGRRDAPGRRGGCDPRGLGSRHPLRSRHPVCGASFPSTSSKTLQFRHQSADGEPVHPLLGGHRGSSGHARNLCPSRRSAPAGLDQEDRALRLTGGRGSGSIWVDGGSIIASEASGAPLADGAAEVVFELLRFKEGDFIFDADSLASDGGAPADVEATLDAAEAMLEEWKVDRGRRAVARRLGVVERTSCPSDEVTIDRDRWAEIVAIGGGTTVGGLGDLLRPRRAARVPHGEGAHRAGSGHPGRGSRRRPPSPAPAAGGLRAPDLRAHVRAPAEAVADRLPRSSTSPSPPSPSAKHRCSPSSTGRLRPSRSGATASIPARWSSSPPSSANRPPSRPADPSAPSVDDDPADAAEIARQLANLSPKAAKAVAAAAKATTQEEREAALAEVDDDEEPINRGLLLKFLGSVNG